MLNALIYVHFPRISISCLISALCLLSNDIYDYHYVSQGKVTVASIDDKEDMEFTHVSQYANNG